MQIKTIAQIVNILIPRKRNILNDFSQQIIHQDIIIDYYVWIKANQSIRLEYQINNKI